MKLYLVRHAVAVEHGDPAYPNDDDRPLTEKGRKQFRKAARGFLEFVDAPALLLTSPLPRAMQTADILQEACGQGTSTAVCAGLRPGGSFEQVLQDCAAYGSGMDPAQLERGIALVGHNPALGLLGAWLLCGDDASFGLSIDKGGIALLTFDELPAPGRADLQWLVTPKLLRALA